MGKQIRVLLWDIDGTLLDFNASERAGIRNTFSDFGLGECTDEMLSVYSRINNKHWEMLERGECTKHETMVQRFVEFFALYGIETDVEAFNDTYQRRLPETIVFRPHAWETVTALSGRYRQACITNGNLPVQLRKLRDSGLIRVFDRVFISDEVGCEKPSTAFFSAVLLAMDCSPDEALVIGDSLSSDILGANRSGIPCVWYNPEGKPQKPGIRADRIISDLDEIPALLNEF